MLTCPKCLDQFRKQHRLDAHLLKCKGKVCRNCKKVGHLACGISISGKELLEKIKKQAEETDKPVRVIGMF